MFKILIVDDNANTRKYLSAVLTAEHFEAVTAVNGLDALGVIEHEKVDLAIVDVMMPEIDGYELVKMLRDAGNDMPVLMVSAKQLPADRKQGFKSGADDYITKPFDAEELVLRIRALLRRSQIMSERRIVLGSSVLDYESFTVTGHGETVELPQKEFLLLYKLLSYPGQIFTRIQLMDEIWGPDSDSGPETVTVHIGRLRKRFEGWDEFELVSVRGIGYKAVKKV